MEHNNKNENEVNLITLLCKPYYDMALSVEERGVLSQFLESNKLDQRPADNNLVDQLLDARSRKDEQWAKLWNMMQHSNSTECSPKPHASIKPMYRLAKIAIAATIIAAAGIVGFKYLFPHKNNAITGQHDKVNTDVPPGRPKATLILADSTKIELNNAAVGVVVNEEGISVNKLDSAQIIYKTKGLASKNAAMHNLITPRAGIFKVTLPDNTIMYLNAESSVAYPVAFNGPTREVRIDKGEVYFEVAPDDHKPFIVRNQDQAIEVLGTKFNINTYDKDNSSASTTTLLEGKIEISNGIDHRILKPRDQAFIVSHASNIQVRSDIDATGVIAWKEGYFTFNNVQFHEVMEEVERWYDVQVNISPEVANLLDAKEITFSMISRKLHLDKFLDKLSEGIKFSYAINGKIVTINK